jgi:hypothetical protein
VIRERLGAIALRAYPRETRRARGPEMLSMALDACGRSKLLFARETTSLVFGGVRERAMITAQPGARRLVADAFCQAAVLWTAAYAWQGLAIAFAPASHGRLIGSVISTMVLACALVGYDRVAGIAGACGIAAILTISLSSQFSPLAIQLRYFGAGPCLVLAGFVVMIRAPRPRPRDARRLLWLIPLAVLVLLPAGHNRLGWSSVNALEVVSAYALIRLADDPRLAIACGLLWATIAYTIIYSALVTHTHPTWIVGAPLLLVVGAVRLRSIRRAGVAQH